MEIFLGISLSSLRRLDPADVDDNGYTAMMYLESRSNVEDLKGPSQQVLNLIESARSTDENLTRKFAPLADELVNNEEDTFLDAVETQMGTAA